MKSDIDNNLLRLNRRTSNLSSCIRSWWRSLLDWRSSISSHRHSKISQNRPELPSIKRTQLRPWRSSSHQHPSLVYSKMSWIRANIMRWFRNSSNEMPTYRSMSTSWQRRLLRSINLLSRPIPKSSNLNRLSRGLCRKIAIFSRRTINYKKRSPRYNMGRASMWIRWVWMRRIYRRPYNKPQNNINSYKRKILVYNKISQSYSNPYRNPKIWPTSYRTITKGSNKRRWSTIISRSELKSYKEISNNSLKRTKYWKTRLEKWILTSNRRRISSEYWKISSKGVTSLTTKGSGLSRRWSKNMRIRYKSSRPISNRSNLKRIFWSSHVRGNRHRSETYRIK